MPEVWVVDAAGDLDWVDYEIPDSNVPVGIATLRASPSRALTLFVRFPTGWERPPSGWYAFAEEFVVLDGTLEMSARTFEAGSWAYVPAGFVRAASAAPAEAFTLARFDGPARWIAGPPGDATNGRSLVRGSLAPEGSPDSSPLGAGNAWLLRRGARESSWLLDAPAEGSIASRDAELLALGSRTWAWVPQGAPYPRLEGLCFCRTFEAEEGP